jgi:hypothetical protein
VPLHQVDVGLDQVEGLGVSERAVVVNAVHSVHADLLAVQVEPVRLDLDFSDAETVGARELLPVSGDEFRR